jgi:hypothetical protein
MLRYASLVLGPEWEVRPWGTEGEFKFPFARVANMVPVTAAGPRSYTDLTTTYALHCYPTPGASPDDSIMEVERVRELLHVGYEIGFPYTDALLDPDSASLAVILAAGGSLLATTALHYYVSAVGDGGETAAMTVGPLVTAGAQHATLAWAPVSGARGYRIYRTSAAQPNGLIAAVTPNVLAFLDDGTLVGDGTPIPVTPGNAANDALSAKKRVPLYDYADVTLDGPGAFSNERQSHDYIRVLDCAVEEGSDPEDDTQFRVIAQVRVTWRRMGAVPPNVQTLEEVRLRTDPAS